MKESVSTHRLHLDAATDSGCPEELLVLLLVVPLLAILSWTSTKSCVCACNCNRCICCCQCAARKLCWQRMHSVRRTRGDMTDAATWWLDRGITPHWVWPAKTALQILLWWYMAGDSSHTWQLDKRPAKDCCLCLIKTCMIAKGTEGGLRQMLFNPSACTNSHDSSSSPWTHHVD